MCWQPWEMSAVLTPLLGAERSWAQQAKVLPLVSEFADHLKIICQQQLTSKLVARPSNAGQQVQDSKEVKPFKHDVLVTLLPGKQLR